MSMTVHSGNNQLAHYHGNDQYSQREWPTGDCGHQPPRPPPKKPVLTPQVRRNLLIGLGSLVVLVGLLALIVYLVLQPKEPRFVLRRLAVLEGPNDTSSLLTRTIQATVTSLNPNDRVGVIYDRLDAYASYRDRQFTVAVSLPPSYMARENGAAEWSPLLYGSGAAETPELEAALAQDVAAGRVLLAVRLEGRLRWKVLTWVSTPYRVFVTCRGYVIIAKDVRNGVVRGSGTRFQQEQSCAVEVSI